MSSPYHESGLSARISRMLASRSPRKREFVLSQKNIYIFPSKTGLAYLAVCLLMLVTAINYQSSLVYFYTFVLAAMFFMSIWLCFFNLSGLELRAGNPMFVSPSEESCYELTLHSSKAPVSALYLSVLPEHRVNAELEVGERISLHIKDAKRSRGVYVPDKVRVDSLFPFGLIVAWTWLKLDSICYVYPEPVPYFGERMGRSGTDEAEHLRSNDDMTNLKAYQAGESAKRINWKHYASKETLVVREGEPKSFTPGWVRWDDYEAQAAEQRLSYMCYDVLQCSERQELFGLECPGTTIAPAKGEAHRLKCLALLASFNQTSAAVGI